MILAAGLGTRLKPFTDNHPKALAHVNGKSVLQRNVQWLQQYGITDVIVNVHHFAEQIVEAVHASKGWGSNVRISNESDEVLETGGGILKASWFLRQTTDALVMNADILTNLPLDKMLAFHRQYKPLATLATTNRATSRYLLFENNTLCGWKNTKTGECKGRDGEARAFSGIQILHGGIFNKIKRSGKFSMIDVYLELCSSNTILSFDHSNTKLIDIGTVEKLQEAEGLFAR
jgi:NDP-sugar pyrophosphorylase family protein